MLKFTVQLLSFLLLCNCLGCVQPISEKKYTIGFSQCCTDNWREVMEAEMNREIDFYEQAELNIKVANGNSQKQIAQIKQFLAEGIDVLIVTPNEAEPLKEIIEEVYNKGIPIILVDRETTSDKYTTYVGANNYEIGKTAGHYIASQTNKSGEIIELALPSSMTPSTGRSNGFRDALRQYPNLEIIASFDAGWALENVDNWLSEALEKYPQASIIYGHTDLLAERAYQVIRAKGMTNQFFCLGIDGLAGKNGGIQMVEDEILNASLLYPTGGTESVKAAIQILNNLPIEKRIELNTTVIDPDNARIINHQMEKVLSLQENIGQQKKLINELEHFFQNQQVLIYILIGSLLLTIILGGSFWRSLQFKKEVNKDLQFKNEEIIQKQQQIVQMSEEVKLATQAKVDFFTNISHEFKTPLTLIMGFTDELLPSPKLSKDLQQSIHLIKENANRLLRLVTQLMDFRKMESERMRVKASENDIIAFIKSILRSYHRVAKSRNIDLKIVTRHKQIMLWFDANMIDKVLFNLLSNAFKFTSDNSEIIISISKDNLENQIKIKVEDKGKGMSEETMKHIFEPFFQGEDNMSIGSGLGLPLSKKLIQLHHGDITVQSILGKGSRFIVVLPLGRAHFRADQLLDIYTERFVEDNSSILPIYMEDEFNQGISKPEQTILIIEDNPDIQFFLQKKLKPVYKILEALDGEIGLTIAFEQTPDLIICDIKLPKENGLAITKKLKSDLRTSHIPLLILSSQSGIEQKIEGTKAGADAYMTKPFNVQFLKERIKNLLHNRQLIKENYGNELVEIDDKKVSSSLDQQFLNRFFEYIESNYHRQDLQITDLNEALQLSRSQLYRKTKALIGISVIDYIQNIRLQKAETLLQKGDLTISEIAYQVGYTSPEYFSTVFKNRYGMSPTQFMKA